MSRLLEHRLDGRLERRPLDLVTGQASSHLDAAPEEEQRRAAGHAQLLRELAVGLPEDLEEARLARELLGDGVELRGQRLARRTLRRIEVEDDGRVGCDHLVGDRWRGGGGRTPSPAWINRGSPRRVGTPWHSTAPPSRARSTSPASAWSASSRALLLSGRQAASWSWSRFWSTRAASQSSHGASG